MHPSEAIRGEKSQLLAGKRVVLGVTGSIAAVKTVELARELIRHGADVLPVMSRSATRIIHPHALEFATGHAPVTELTGATEHVRELGGEPDTVAGREGGRAKADLLLVAPCTGNTLSKIALGIDDSPVTTFASTGLTTTPTLLVPAMHETMYDSPFLRENLQRLRDGGVHVMAPKVEEWKAKLPDVEAIVEECLRLLGPQSLRGKRVLVVTGSTIEEVDDMRVITNKSTGRMGVSLAVEAYRLGAEVELWFGHGHVDHLPRHLAIRRFVTVHDLLEMQDDLEGFDAVLMPAAISDYAPPKRAGKIPTKDGRLTLELEPLPKVVQAYRDAFQGALVPFKAESDVDEKQLIARARESLRKHRAPFVVANDLTQVQVDATRVLLVSEGDVEPVEGSKDDVARTVLQRLATHLHGGEAQ